VSRCRHLALLLAACSLALAGCGGTERDAGTATLWVTRDRGTSVLVDTTVPAGQTLLRALRSKAEVGTRYGGRFVQSIEGVEGDAGEHRDWFWFVNGLTGDRSGAEYRLRAGDVAWWDYRDWTDDADLAVVVGAFPEPFLHGYGGKTRKAAVVYRNPADLSDASAIAKAIHARGIYLYPAWVPAGWNVFQLVRGSPRFSARRRSGGGPSDPVTMTFSGDVTRLLGGAYARRFSVP
jgi:Domain of unknown function (DUF4430)